MKKILVVNAGSSSIKVVLFGEDLVAILSAAVTEIGGVSALRVGAKTPPRTGWCTAGATCWRPAA